MNYLGGTKDNIHVNDTEIQNGSLSVDGDLIVDGDTIINGDVEYNGNVTINPPNCLNTDCINSATPATGIEINTEYKLPVVKGTQDQILTQIDAAGNTEFRDLTAGSARVVINKYTGTTSRIRNQTDNGVIISIQQAGFGSFQYTSDEFSEGSVIVIRAYGNWTYLRSSQAFIPEGKFWLLIGPPPNGPELLELFAPFPEKAFAGTFPSSEGSVGNWELNIQLTRINATQFRLGGTLTNSLADVQNQVEIPIIFPQKVGNNPDIFTFPGYPFDVAVKWQDNSNQGGGTAWIYPTLCGYTQDLINAGTNVVATSESLTTDHTLLSNLTAGDAGHTQFALLSGRTLGQTLSGGVLPAESLKLKSHTAGADNVTVKDLNTQFNKNIDMDNNNIINANEITKTTPSGGNLEVKNIDGPIVLSAQGGLSNIQLETPNNIIANCNLFESLAAVNLFNANIVMFGNQIQQTSLVSSNTSLECNATADLRLVGDTVDMAATNAITHAIGPTAKLTIDGVEITSFTDFNMDNNNIINVAGINNLTPVGGVYAGTSDGTLINNTVEQSVLPGSGVGSLSIPPNGFAVGDCFHCVVAGDCVFDKDDTIQIKLKENGNILAQTPIINLEDAQAGDNAFEIEIDFTIRSIGALGSIATNFDFTYNKDGIESKDFRGTRAMDVQPIDTTVSSTLDISVQFPTNVTPSSLQTRLFRLQKVY